MAKKIYIGNCDFKLEESQLESFLSEQGVQVASVQIIRDRFTQRSKGFAFAELNDSQELEAAIQAVNGKELNGRKLLVNEAREREKSPRGNFGGNRDGGNFGGNSRDGGGRSGGRNFGGGRSTGNRDGGGRSSGRGRDFGGNRDGGGGGRGRR